MAIANTNIAPLLKEGSNITLTQDGQVITIASSGGGGGTPGGSDTQIQFNDGGSFGGDSVFTYNKTTNVVGLEAIDFAATPTATDAERRLLYSDDEGTLVYSLKGGNISTPINGALLALVNNGEATTLTKGEIVYAYSASGQRVQVKRAKNDSDATSAKTFGVVAESIASGAEGFVMVHGVVKNINTIAYAEGTSLYLGSTAGTYTSTKPSAPEHLVYVGFVVKSHASAGEIFAKIQNGYELDEIHDVAISSLANNDLLAYESSTSLWKNKTASTLSLVTGTGTSGQITYWSGTNSVTGSSTFVYSPTSQFLVNNSVTASGAIARGINFTPSLTAAANNDSLVALDISPTYTVGAFTGVKQIGIRSSKDLVFSADAYIHFNGYNFGSSIYSDGYSIWNVLRQTTKAFCIQVGNVLSTAQRIVINPTTTTNWDLQFRADTGIQTDVTLQNRADSLILGKWYSSGNWAIGPTSADSGQKLQVTGTSSFTGTTATDGGQLGSELLSTSGWTSTGWTGDFTTGWTHSTGNTTALTNTLAAVNGTYYQITYTVTSRTAGTFVIAFGGYTSGSLSATGAVGPLASSTGTLSITPTTDFDGKIVISIKVIGTSSASITFKSSAGTTTNELRISSINTCMFFGPNSGVRNTTGFNNVAYGLFSLQNVTSGGNNAAFGRSALANCVIGDNNSAFGNSALQYSVSTGNSAFGLSALGLLTTGDSNSAFGYGTLLNITTSSGNTAIGVNAGRYAGSGTTANQTSSNSIYIGNTTRASASGNTNEVVIGYNTVGLGSNTTTIGNSSTTDNYLYGNFNVFDAKNIILGTTTGTKIGTSTSQKIGFWNATPVVQPTAVTTSQGIADALTTLGLLQSSSISTVQDVGGKLYLFNSY